MTTAFALQIKYGAFSKLKDFDPEKPLNILAVRLSAMGDCLLVLPTLRRICAHRPHWKIHWLISKQWLPLFVNQPIECIGIDKPKNIKNYCDLAAIWRPKKIDVVLAMQANLRVNLLYYAVHGDFTLGFDNDRAKEGHSWFIDNSIPAKQQHLYDGFQAFADYLMVPPMKPSWELSISLEAKHWIEKYSLQLNSDKKRIGLAIAASKLERTPYPEFYHAVIQLLIQKYDAQIILIGGKSLIEIQQLKQLQKLLPNEWPNIQNWVGSTSLTQLMALVKSLDILIAPDSGTVHLATALNIPVIGLYAIAPSDLSGPYLHREWTIDHYVKASEYFHHMPEQSQRSWKRVHNREAMQLITVDNIAKKIKILLEKK
ncbi:MAG: glycosyltransferase family 9 protein [Pseudomonadota bacterium]